MTDRPGYRRDIDGLRAISVLAVILYHLDFRYARGGFLGVDIFFVISGYLITSHIVAALEKGTFSLLGFYENRVRRIFPALAVLLMGAGALAYARLLPGELVDFAKSALAAIFSVSNIYFWLHSSYFVTIDRPLLHTWSLAVEEHFYLLLPLGLLWLYRHRRNWRRPALVAIAVASFLLSAATIARHPDATFYLIPQRAWELLIGGLVGLRATRYPRTRTSREVMAAIGFLLIAFFLVWIPDWRFPGPAALPTCLGTAMLLTAGEEGTSFVGRLLSLPPLVAIGVISYSTYLWHLPLIVLQRADTSIVLGQVLPRFFPFLTPGQSLTLERTALLVSLSLLLGALSWKFIEQPIRFGRLRPTRRVLFLTSGTVVAAMIAAALVVLAGNGFPGRFQKDVLQIVSYPEPTQHFKDGVCIPDVASRYDAANCRNPMPGKTNWILFGDSHALVLDYGMTQVFPEVNLMLFGVPACPPYPTRHTGDRNGCYPYYDAFYHDYLPKHPVDLVIFSANYQPQDIPRVGETIAYLHSIHQPVVLIGPIMHYDAPLRYLLASSIMRHDPGLPARHRMLAFDEMDKKMAMLARDDWHVPYFSYSVFCPDGQCVEWAGKNVPLQWDQAHLLEAGSIVAAQRMKGSGLFPAGRADQPGGRPSM